MRNVVPYPQYRRERRIIPALGGIAICLLTVSLVLSQSSDDSAPEAQDLAPSEIGLRGTYMSDIGPHAPSAFAPFSARILPHNVFAFVSEAEAAPLLRTPQTPTPPQRPPELQTLRAVDAAPEPVVVTVDAPTPPRRPIEFSAALRPEPPKEEPAPRQIARIERTTVVPAAPSDGRGFFERIFGGAPQAAAPNAGRPAPHQAMAYANAPDAGGLFGGLRSAVAPANPAARFDRYTAVYDISARTVYMPDGSRLEAHSGLREHLDDPRYVHLRMRGPTPPHIYELTPREALFHGVEALRLNPVGGGGGVIYHRAGLLAHTYMLGPNGDSNGCVSFRDYHAFLNAYKRGEVRRLAVVSRM